MGVNYKLLVHNPFLYTVMDTGNTYMRCTMFLLQQGPVLQPEHRIPVPISAAQVVEWLLQPTPGQGLTAAFYVKTLMLTVFLLVVWMSFNVSSSTNCADSLFCPSVGTTPLFCTMAMLEPQMTGLLKMETYGKQRVRVCVMFLVHCCCFHIVCTLRKRIIACW